MQGAERLLSVQTIFQSKEDTIYGAVVGPLLGKRLVVLKDRYFLSSGKGGFALKFQITCSPWTLPFPLVILMLYYVLCLA